MGLKQTNKIVLMVALLVVAMFTGSCFMKKTNTQSINRDNFRFAMTGDVETLHFSSSNKGSPHNSSYVMNLLFDGLMRKGKHDIPEPAIAYKVDVSRDQKKYTFHLRDCTWSDGHEVTSHDFEYAWKKLIDPNSGSITVLPELFYPIKNVRNCILGKCKTDDVGIVVIDNKTLLVELEYPSPYFLEIVSTPFYYPAPKHVAEKDSAWAHKPGLVCNGPFTLDERNHGSDMLLVKNPLHWDEAHVYLNGIEISVVPDSETALNMFRQGMLDWIGSPFMRAPYDTSSDVLEEGEEDALIYWLAVNTDKYPFNNKKLRKALSYALDRKSTIKNVFEQTATPVMSAFPISMRLTNEPYFEDNNVALAKELFQEALDELGLSAETFPEIGLLYISDLDFCRRIVLCAQEQWRKNLGIQVSLKGFVGWNLFIDTIRQGNFELAMTGCSAVISDQLQVLNLFKNSSDSCNRCNWENEEFKSLLDRSNHAIGEIERIKLLIEAETILMDEMPVIPLCSMKKRYGKNPKVKGECMSFLQSVDFKSVYFEENEGVSDQK